MLGKKMPVYWESMPTYEGQRHDERIQFVFVGYWHGDSAATGVAMACLVVFGRTMLSLFAYNVVRVYGLCYCFVVVFLCLPHAVSDAARCAPYDLVEL